MTLNELNSQLENCMRYMFLVEAFDGSNENPQWSDLLSFRFTTRSRSLAEKLCRLEDGFTSPDRNIPINYLGMNAYVQIHAHDVWELLVNKVAKMTGWEAGQVIIYKIDPERRDDPSRLYRATGNE